MRTLLAVVFAWPTITGCWGGTQSLYRMQDYVLEADCGGVRLVIAHDTPYIVTDSNSARRINVETADALTADLCPDLPVLLQDSDLQ